MSNSSSVDVVESTFKAKISSNVPYAVVQIDEVNTSVFFDDTFGIMYYIGNYDAGLSTKYVRHSTACY